MNEMLYAPKGQQSLLCLTEFIFRLSIKLSRWGGASVTCAVSQQLMHVHIKLSTPIPHPTLRQ